MGFNFLDCDREQRFLLAPDMRDWLPDDDIALFVIDAVDRLDLSNFYASYRADGWGRAAFHPKMMVALVLYAYAIGERSARGIERACRRDVGFRVVSANDTPDHSTIARFMVRHEDALKGLFGQVLALCVKAGLVKPGVVAIDGTKIAANASAARNLTAEQIRDLTDKIFEEAKRINEEEDRLYGDNRGDELRDDLKDRKRRLEWLDEQLKAGNANTKRINGTDPDSRVMKAPHGFVQAYNAQLAVTEDHIVVAHEVTNDVTDVGRLQPMVTQASDNLDGAGAPDAMVTVVADAGYLSDDNIEADLGVDTLIAPVAAKDLDAVERVDDDLDDYNARKQAIQDDDVKRAEALERAVTGEITMYEARDLMGLATSRAYVLKDLYLAGGIDGIRRRSPPPPKRRPTTQMRRRFTTEEAKAAYAKRAITVEPVIGQTKEARGARRFMRRGRQACATEWSLLMTTHNIRRMWTIGFRSSHLLLATILQLLRMPMPVEI